MNTSDYIIVPFKISKETYIKMYDFSSYCSAVNVNFEKLLDAYLSDLFDSILSPFESLE